MKFRNAMILAAALAALSARADFGCSHGRLGVHWECDANGQFCKCVTDPPGMVCEASTRGPVCKPLPPSSAAAEPLCLDGNAHVVSCDTVAPSATTRCSMTEEWNLGDPDHPAVTALTPVCADEADIATSQTVTKIIKLGK